MEDKLVLNELWEFRLNSAASVLFDVSKETENEFLDLGSNLQNFSFTCIENASHAATFVQTLESGEGFNVTMIAELFEKVYKEIEKTAEIVVNGSQGITDIISNLNQIMDLELFLKKLARTISIIGTLIRIEAARVGNADFNVTTDVVDSLARQILKGTSELVMSIKEADTTIDAINNLREPFVNLYEHELASTKSQVKRILEKLGDMADQARWLCERISHRAYKISPELGEVVTAIQFHDITRQQMEHVAEVLHEINEKMTGFDSNDEKGKYTLLRWMHDALKIQISQLQFVLSETEKAANKISVSLFTVSELQEAQAEDANTILSEEQSGKDRIAMMSNILEALLFVLTTVNYTTTEMISNISGAASKLGGMSTQVTNIRTISDSMNLLALNAIIKVARTGAAGHGLGVLAEEISKQSKAAQEKINGGAKVINEVLVLSADFTESLNLRLREQVGSSETITQQTKEALDKLMEGDKELMSAMNGISHSAKNLEVEIGHVISNISFDKIIKNKLTEVADEIEAVLSEVRDKIPDHIYDHVDYSPDLDDMLKRYTMDSERLIHKDSLGHSTDGAEALMWDGESTAGSASQNKDGFDDNIELF
ncbi:MAG: methyl-accepting chemotaxis protein [Nitrospirae bacterium YQR-1]